jgi:hypothetical protein
MASLRSSAPSTTRSIRKPPAGTFGVPRYPRDVSAVNTSLLEAGLAQGDQVHVGRRVLGVEVRE